MAADVAVYLACWQPVSVPPQAARFARSVVELAVPPTRARANALLWAAARLAAFAVPLGLDPVPEVLLHPSVIERFAVSAPGLSGSARRTLRTNLRFIARRVVPALAPADMPLPRERAKAPYSTAEIAGYLALADAQPALARRMRAAGLVALGAGAGLTGADLRGVRGSDVGLPLRRGRRGRARRPAAGGAGPVPLPRHLAGLGAVRRTRADHRRDQRRAQEHHHPADPVAGRGTGLPRLEASGLRPAWLADCARLLDLATFMHAAAQPTGSLPPATEIRMPPRGIDAVLITGQKDHVGHVQSANISPGWPTAARLAHECQSARPFAGARGVLSLPGTRTPWRGGGEPRLHRADAGRCGGRAARRCRRVRGRAELGWPVGLDRRGRRAGPVLVSGPAAASPPLILSWPCLQSRPGAGSWSWTPRSSPGPVRARTSARYSVG